MFTIKDPVTCYSSSFFSNIYYSFKIQFRTVENYTNQKRFGKSLSQQQGNEWPSGVDLKVPCNVIGLTLITLSIALTVVGLGAKAKYRDFGRRRSKEYREFVRDTQAYRKFEHDDDRDDITGFNKRNILSKKSRQFERGKVYQLRPLRKRIITPSASSSDKTEWESTEDEEFECPRKNHLAFIKCCCQLDKYPFSITSNQYLEERCRRTLKSKSKPQSTQSDSSQRKTQVRKKFEDEGRFTDSFSKFRNLVQKDIKNTPDISEFLHHNETTKAQKRANSWSSHIHMNTLNMK